MKSGLRQILRFEIARILNKYGGSPEYRWIYRPDGNRVKVVTRRPGHDEEVYSLRKNTSDFEVFFEIFHRLQYSTRGLARNSDIKQRYKSILDAGKRPLIIDAGANVGLATLYFRHAYPDAAIVAVEPEAANFLEIHRHLGDDSLLLPIQAAIGPDDGYVEIIDEGRDAWGFRTRTLSDGRSADTQGHVQSLTVDSLIALASKRWPVHPFILKVDIEGFEEPLFQNDPSWIDDFYVMMVELHDWMLPKSRSSRPFVETSITRDRDFLIRGESIFSIANHDPGEKIGPGIPPAKSLALSEKF